MLYITPHPQSHLLPRSPAIRNKKRHATWFSFCLFRWHKRLYDAGAASGWHLASGRFASFNLLGFHHHHHDDDDDNDTNTITRPRKAWFLLFRRNCGHIVIGTNGRHPQVAGALGVQFEQQRGEC